jgi:ribonuclease HII
MTAHFHRETKAIAEGLWPLAGVDEVGRGPLAGPVVAAAVILDPQAVPDGLDDSKNLTPARRDELFALIAESALAIGVASAAAAEIDAVNIRQATLLAMRRAVAALALPPAFVLVDGNDPPTLACPAESVIGGDAQIASIAAASIVAKVHRDRVMRELDERYPGYGFAAHAGYATSAHMQALRSLGPSPVHRKSFAPVRALLQAV